MAARPEDLRQTSTVSTGPPQSPHADQTAGIDLPSPSKQPERYAFSGVTHGDQGPALGAGIQAVTPTMVTEPPRIGRVLFAGDRTEPLVLTRRGPMTLEAFKSHRNFFLLFPPLHPHPGVPLNEKGAFDMDAFRRSQGGLPVRTLDQPADENGWGPPLYEC
ncbi:alveolin domain containing intermediate filament IMC3 [Besnoitia besnoiti]|uniref:Alveolin domain containing intermediate filament IMC3 n=1 Tax=Besnoitia besnoiti TaxID=94643 RepID=A0A2A9MQ31_BESBE|nr:alveolin domain containing intermediate filament IMC3 [Besnoitia besnoiti]PFH38022.1 alveolin domain containing intermediate filament IMC3 [Besnoitia besnoiti]